MPSAVLQFVEALNRRLFRAETTGVSITEGVAASITNPVEKGTAAALAPRIMVSIDRVRSSDPLLAYRSGVLA